MDLISVLAIAVGLAMDAFAVSITNGITQTKSHFRQALITAASFGLFQGVMPFLGWALGSSFSDKIQFIDHWIACLLLAIIGGRMIYEAIKDTDGEQSKKEFNYKLLIIMSFATSIDALVIGVSFSLSGVNSISHILLNSLIITSITTIVCVAGFYIGRFFGTFLKKKAEIAGGIILILMGLKILLDHLLLN